MSLKTLIFIFFIFWILNLPLFGSRGNAGSIPEDCFGLRLNFTFHRFLVPQRMNGGELKDGLFFPLVFLGNQTKVAPIYYAFWGCDGSHGTVLLSKIYANRLPISKFRTPKVVKLERLDWNALLCIFFLLGFDQTGFCWLHLLMASLWLFVLRTWWECSVGWVRELNMREPSLSLGLPGFVHIELDKTLNWLGSLRSPMSQWKEGKEGTGGAAYTIERDELGFGSTSH